MENGRSFIMRDFIFKKILHQHSEYTFEVIIHTFTVTIDLSRRSNLLVKPLSSILVDLNASLPVCINIATHTCCNFKQKTEQLCQPLIYISKNERIAVLQMHF